MNKMNGIPKPDSVTIAYDDHRKGVQLSIQLNRWILKPIGVWPRTANEKFSRKEKYLYPLINVICIGLIGFLFVPCVIFMALELDDTYITLKLVGPLTFCAIAVIKYMSLICHENEIRTGIEYIENDWMNTRHYSDRTIMVKNAKFGRRLVAICASFMYGSAVLYYLVMPFAVNGLVTENDGNWTYRPLVYPVARVIVDVRRSLISEIFFWTQCLSGFIVHSIATGACSLAAVLAMHAYGRLEVLMRWIENLVDGQEDLCDNVDVDERLMRIVQQHIRILRFISLTDKVLREISIVEITGNTFNLCLLGYYIISEWGYTNPTSYITYAILLTSITFNTFILCYIGELIVNQCKKIGEVSYMIDWHRLQRKNGLAIILIIAMSNSSIKLTAGNILDLSFNTFGDVIKTSMAYLNMLRTLTS